MDSQHKWKEYSISEIFNILPGKRLTKADMVKGDKPFIGATDSNNGITDWVSNYNESEDKDVLGVNYNGSVVETFYHPYKCIFSDDVKRFHLKDNSVHSQYVMQFLKSIILKQKDKYAWGYKFNEKRMLKQKILLPVTADGSPDWQYMEEYMRQKEHAILKPAVEKLCWRIINNNLLPPPKKIHKTSLYGVEWKEFQIGDLFNAKRPVGRKEDDYEEGNTAFVASGGVNNGVTKFCKAQTGEKLDKGNCLTVSPVDGSCYYQPVDFLGRGGAGSSIIILYAKDFELNRFNGLFISKAISQTASSKYSYGRMASLDRIKKDKILLPSDSNGNPDFAFMSSFMQEVEKDILGTTLKYFEDKTR